MTDTAIHDSLLHLPPAALVALHRALARDRSPTEAAALAREIGFETGEAFFQTLQRWLEERQPASGTDPSQLPSEEFWGQLSGFFASLGWGRLEFEQLHPGIASLSSGEWAEAEAAGSATQPTCHFTTGLLADLLGRVAGTDLAVMEVECRSRGEQRCRFLIGSPEALERIYGTLREGGSYEAALHQLA